MWDRKEMHTNAIRTYGMQSGNQGLLHYKDTICVRVWMINRSFKRDKKTWGGLGRKTEGRKECKGTYGLWRYFNPGIFQSQIKTWQQLVYFVKQIGGIWVEEKKSYSEKEETPPQGSIPELLTTMGNRPSGTCGLYFRFVISAHGTGLYLLPSKGQYCVRCLNSLG